jgi:hypothetical protein
MRHALRSRRFVAPMLATRRRFTAVVLLLAVTVFGATIQGGLLAPNFHNEGTGYHGNVRYIGALENVSWRSWTISDPRLAGGRREAPFEKDRSVVALMYRSGSFDGSGPAVRHLDLHPGQTVMLRVEVDGGGCMPAYTFTGTFARLASPQPRHPVTVEATVTTPLGSRTIHQTFEVSCLR